MFDKAPAAEIARYLFRTSIYTMARDMSRDLHERAIAIAEKLVALRPSFETEPGPFVKLLIVCFGNTCRSPMAGGVAWRIGMAKGTDLEVRTAGVAAQDRRPVSPFAVDAMKKIGVDVSQDFSKPVTRDLLEWADMVVTVDRNLALGLRHRHPEMATKIRHLDADVPDPHRPDATWADYEKCRDLLEELLLKLPIWTA